MARARAWHIADVALCLLLAAAVLLINVMLNEGMEFERWPPRIVQCNATLDLEETYHPCEFRWSLVVISASLLATVVAYVVMSMDEGYGQIPGLYFVLRDWCAGPIDDAVEQAVERDSQTSWSYRDASPSPGRRRRRRR